MESYQSYFSFLPGHFQVLMLFLIPFGIGIPSGVLLAKNFMIHWPIIMLLYFISDIILAFVYEACLILTVKLLKKTKAYDRVSGATKKWIQKTTQRYGNILSPVTLVTISFGVDPMTGRAATIAAGHGFVSGWILAIIGDMIYFTILMASTLWLVDILGDGTLTTFIILVLMIVIPMIVRKVREQKKAS